MVERKLLTMIWLVDGVDGGRGMSSPKVNGCKSGLWFGWSVGPGDVDFGGDEWDIEAER